MWSQVCVIVERNQLKSINSSNKDLERAHQVEYLLKIVALILLCSLCDGNAAAAAVF